VSIKQRISLEATVSTGGGRGGGTGRWRKKLNVRADTDTQMLCGGVSGNLQSPKTLNPNPLPFFSCLVGMGVVKINK